MDPVALLPRSALFRAVPVEDLEPLAAKLRSRTYARDSYLFHEGDPGNQLFVIMAGQVKIARLGRGGDEVVFAVLGPGEVFGELALLDEDGARTCDAQAMDVTECVTLGKDALIEFISSRPEVTRLLLGSLCGYIRRKDDAYAEAAFLDIPGRVARKLLELAESHGEKTSDGVRITVRMSQRTLAGLVAASRENVNRALSRFASEGAIRQDRGTITVLKPALLRRRA